MRAQMLDWLLPICLMVAIMWADVSLRVTVAAVVVFAVCGVAFVRRRTDRGDRTDH